MRVKSYFLPWLRTEVKYKSVLSSRAASATETNCEHLPRIAPSWLKSWRIIGFIRLGAREHWINAPALVIGSDDKPQHISLFV